MAVHNTQNNFFLATCNGAFLKPKFQYLSFIMNSIPFSGQEKGSSGSISLLKRWTFSRTQQLLRGSQERRWPRRSWTSNNVIIQFNLARFKGWREFCQNFDAETCAHFYILGYDLRSMGLEELED